MKLDATTFLASWKVGIIMTVITNTTIFLSHYNDGSIFSNWTRINARETTQNIMIFTSSKALATSGLNKSTSTKMGVSYTARCLDVIHICSQNSKSEKISIGAEIYLFIYLCSTVIFQQKHCQQSRLFHLRSLTMCPMLRMGLMYSSNEEWLLFSMSKGLAALIKVNPLRVLLSIIWNSS